MCFPGGFLKMLSYMNINQCKNIICDVREDKVECVCFFVNVNYSESKEMTLLYFRLSNVVIPMFGDSWSIFRNSNTYQNC